MSDHRQIEPYSRDVRTKYRDHSQEHYSHSRGTSHENRKQYEGQSPNTGSGYRPQSFERHHEENHKYREQAYPSAIGRREVYESDRHRGEGFREHDYRPHQIHGSSSRSPIREEWRSGRAHHSPSSPLRGGSSSPHRVSPGHHHHHPPPFVPMDDPVERQSLLAELDDLKQKMHHKYIANSDEVNGYRANKENEIKEILAKKDALVEESHHRIH